MSIRIIPGSKKFTDINGVETTGYKANAGDPVAFQFDIEESIHIQASESAPIRVTNGFTTTQPWFIFPNYQSMNGFAIGQNIHIEASYGGSTYSFDTTITDVNYQGLYIAVASIGGMTMPSGQIFLGSLNSELLVYSLDNRGELYLNMNHVLGSLAAKNDFVASSTPGGFSNAVAPYRASLIDGTQNILFYDFSAVIVGGSGTMQQFNNWSGNFRLSGSFERLTDTNDYTRKYRFVIETVQPGILIPQGFRNPNSPSLSYYMDFEWYSIAWPDDPTVLQWNFNLSNTGFFDFAFWVDTPDSFLIQPITGIIYTGSETTHQIQIQGPADIHIGASYVPQDETYFKNKTESQEGLCMLLDMVPAAIGTYESSLSPFDARYEIEITAVDYTAGVHTIDFAFRPKPGSEGETFTGFMDGRSATDRVFYIWFKVGNVNHLVFNNTLTEDPKPIVDMADYQGDLDANYPRITTDKQSDFYVALDGANVSTEDNMLLITGGLFPKSLSYQGAYMRLIVAELANPDNKFTLEESYFSFAQQNVQPDGIVDLSIIQSTSENLQSTSGLLRSLRLSRQGVFLPSDTSTHFGMAFYFPFVINWRYWQEQSNAFAEFYPNQNKDYINYINDDFGIFAEVYLVGDTLDIRGVYPINVIYDYGEEFTTATEEWQGSITPTYFINSNDQPVSTLINGQVIRMEWTVNTGIEALANSYWGNITIEPKENMPRWMISSNYAHDNNVNNPFAPLAGQDRLKRELIGPNQVKYSCLIDCSKLNNNSLYKVTIKHFNQNVKNEQVREDYDIKTVDFPFVIEESIGGQTDCCEIMKVFGSSTSNESYKNQKTSAFKKIMDGNIFFELYKDGVLTEYQPEVIPFVSDSDALYATINWSDVLESDGEGCYEYIIRYVDEFENEFTQTWGKYLLMEWSIENCAGLVQIDSVFNSNQSIQNINFTNSFVADTLNIPGMFGKRDPKTQIDNNIYGNRISVKVVRENLNQYTLETDPITSFLSRKLTDLHLLSENECRITDYNSFNHDNYVNFPVIVDEVQSPEYYDYSPKAKFSALFSDKTKNQRSFY